MCLTLQWRKLSLSKLILSRADNEPNQLKNSSKFDSTIFSSNLVYEPNELNLSSNEVC